MNIKFKKLMINNFLSIGSIEVNLDDQGFVLVEGVNLNPEDNAKSNGSGKSAIAEALMFALTGDTIRSTKDIVRKGCIEGTEVKLEFELNNHNYIIIRYKEHVKFGNNIKIFKDEEDISGKGIRDTEDVIRNEFPDLSKDLVGGVIILGQGLPQRFTNNSPVERKSILEKLSKSDYMIDDIKQKLSNRKSELQTSLRSKEDLILGNEREIRLKREDYNNVSIELGKCNGLEELTTKYNELNKVVQGLLVQTSNKRNEISIYDSELLNLNEDILTLTELHNKQRELETNELKETLRPLWAKKSVNESRIDQLKREIRRAKDIKDICPTCGQKLQGVICIDTTAMEKELEELKSNLNDLENKTMQTDSQIKAIELLYLEKKDIKDLKETYKIKQSEKIALEREWTVLNNQYQLKQRELNTIEVELNSYEGKIRELTNKKLNLQESIDDLDKTIKVDYDEKEIIQTRLDIIQKLITTAQREFRTYLLESIIVYIDKRVKFYSKQLFNAEADFKQDGNMIYIGVNSKQYESLSGGERQKIDICVQFAIRDMLIDILGFNSNILYVDELFDNLDQTGTDSLINMITKELGSIESVYIITHHTDTMVPFDKKLQIVKDESGITHLLNN